MLLCGSLSFANHALSFALQSRLVEARGAFFPDAFASRLAFEEQLVVVADEVFGEVGVLVLELCHETLRRRT